MTNVGLLSDTHGYLEPKVYDFFNDCDQIWHAGDIGDAKVADSLEAFKPFKAVYGNIDGTPVRMRYPESLRFMCESVDVWIKHIGGYPGNYDRSVRKLIKNKPPSLFISGHSHICKVMPDKSLGLLHMNPGAIGINGFHQVRTALRFCIDGPDIKNLEVLELARR